MEAGPHLCHDISIRHIQVILVQFAEEVNGQIGSRGEDSHLITASSFPLKSPPSPCLGGVVQVG